jgi:hypothetical protein
MFQMLGVFAEFERAIIRERVVAGMARAKAKGTMSGKPTDRSAGHPSPASCGHPRRLWGWRSWPEAFLLLLPRSSPLTKPRLGRLWGPWLR